jgi:four helix bundle protein
MPPHRGLAVIDAAEQFAADIARLVDDTPRLLHKHQLLKSAQSVSANIAEAFGRVSLPERKNRLSIARGETEEAIRHLRANFRAARITPRTYWPFHNRGVTISKMLSRLLY